MFLVRKIVSWEKLITTNVPVVFGKMESIEASRQHCENWRVSSISEIMEH